MKKVLIITYYWPPSGGAGVQRWLKFAKYLPDFGWSPVIYTPENPEAPADDPTLFRDIREATTVLKQPITEPYSWYKKFIGHNKEQRINAGFLSEGRKPGFREMLATWIRGNLFIPDARKFWIKPSIKFLLKYLEKNKVDAIVSSGPPHSMHLIALGIRKKYDIPWLADFRDPWTGIDFYRDLRLTGWADRKHRKLERLVLTSADRVVSIGNNAARELEDLGATDVEVISNGYDHEDFTGQKPAQGSCFTIVHAGAINKDRNHPIFWKSVVNLKNENAFQNINWKIKFVGKVDFSVSRDIQKYNLEDHVELIPYVPHEEIIQIERSASVLYLPLNNTPNAKSILTGKVFEYMGAKRPVLAIGPVDGDLADILASTGAGLVSDFDDQEGFTNNIRKYVKAFKSGKLSASADATDKYSRKNLTMKLSKVLNDMCK